MTEELVLSNTVLLGTSRHFNTQNEDTKHSLILWSWRARNHKYKSITIIYERLSSLSREVLVRGRGLWDRERRRVGLGVKVIWLSTRAGIALAKVRGLRGH